MYQICSSTFLVDLINVVGEVKKRGRKKRSTWTTLPSGTELRDDSLPKCMHVDS